MTRELEPVHPFSHSAGRREAPLLVRWQAGNQLQKSPQAWLSLTE